VGATPDLSRIALSSCAALAAGAAEELPLPGGDCDPEAQNLYLRSASALKLINLLPGDAQSTPGAEIAAQSGAVSTDGSRAYFTDDPGSGANLYLREGAETKQVDEAQGGGGNFEAASADGSVAYFTLGGSLYRYLAQTGAASLIAAGVQGVLGASADGSVLYYLADADLYRWSQGTVSKIASSTPVAAAASSSDYPAAVGTARVSADGDKLAFLSAAQLTGFDPKGATELYLYSSGAGITCVSCNSTATKPLGSASIPGALANGASLRVYKPRALSASGDRLFFDTKDALLSSDTNGGRDVYQWEAQGIGSCAKAGGCVDLISTGKAEDGASFIDASIDGSDVFFASDGALVAGDVGGLYDARVGGGFPVAPVPIPCVGDDCQPLPGEPEDPTPGTLLLAGGNELLPHPKPKKCKKGQVKKNGKCVKKSQGQRHARSRR
jgi:hypothetical protein